MNLDKDIIKKGALSFGVDLLALQLEQFSAYCDLIRSENDKYNITAITNPEEIATKHFIDSLAACLAINFTEIKSLVDIGSGPGLPGFAIKIAFSHIKLFAIESNGKKVRFLELLAQTLDLEDVNVLNIRAEDATRFYPDLKGSVDVATARAVGDLPKLLDYASPILRKRGNLLLWKGRDEVTRLTSRTQIINRAGFELVNVYPYKIPLWQIERFLIKLIKI